MPHEDDVPDIPEEAPLETDLYETLGVKGDATADQIKSAYRKLALKHHPGEQCPFTCTSLSVLYTLYLRIGKLWKRDPVLIGQ